MRASRAKRREIGRRLVAAGLSIAVASLASPLRAQSDTLLQPTLPDDYDQSRNQSVVERLHPDYDPLGIRLGGFVAYPAIGLSVAATDNAFVTSGDRKGDVFGRFAPSMDIRSDWSRHMLDLSAQGVFLHHAGQRALDRDTWNVTSSARLDVGDFGSVAIEGRAAKLQEDPFTSQTDPSLAVLSSYRSDHVAMRAERQVGRTRIEASVDATRLRFGDIAFADGERQDQAQRDRSLITGAAQAEYALSPGAVLLARAAYTGTDYDRRLADGGPNRDASTLQVAGGLNLDLPGFVRGTLQLGYVRKNYEAVDYKSVGGVSGEVKLEYFASDLMDFEVEVHRVLQDSATSDNNPYFETMAYLGAHRAIRENLIAGAKIGAGRQAYVDSPIRYDIVQISGYLRYLASRWLSLRLDAGYGRRDQAGAGGARRIDQSTIMMTMELHK